MTFEFANDAVRKYVDNHRDQYDSWKRDIDRLDREFPGTINRNAYLALTLDANTLESLVFCTVDDRSLVDIDGTVNVHVRPAPGPHEFGA